MVAARPGVIYCLVSVFAEVTRVVVTRVVTARTDVLSSLVNVFAEVTRTVMTRPKAGGMRQMMMAMDTARLTTMMTMMPQCIPVPRKSVAMAKIMIRMEWLTKTARPVRMWTAMDILPKPAVARQLTVMIMILISIPIMEFRIVGTVLTMIVMASLTRIVLIMVIQAMT